MLLAHLHSSIQFSHAMFFFFVPLMTPLLWVQNFTASVTQAAVRSVAMVCELWSPSAGVDREALPVTLSANRSHFTYIVFLSFSLCHPSCKNTFICGLSFFFFFCWEQQQNSPPPFYLRWRVDLLQLKMGAARKTAALECVWPITCTKSCRL